MTQRITSFFSKNKQRFALLFRHVRQADVQVFLVCFSIAVVLWFFNALNHPRSEIIKYPIEVIYDSNKYIALEAEPKFILLKVHGTGWQIFWKTVSPKVEPIKIFTPSVISNNRPYLLTKSYLSDINSRAVGLKIENIISDTIPIRLDRKIKRRYFLKIDPFDINLQTNHRIIGDIEFTPKQLTIEGPESYLERIPNPYPVLIPQRNIREDFAKEVMLGFRVQKPALLSLSADEIKVKFKVDEYLYKTNSLVVQLAHFPEDSKFTLHKNHRRVDIRYAFRSKDIGKIRLSDFLIVADFKTFNPKDSTVNLVLKRKPNFIYKDDINFKPKVKLDYEKK